MIQTCKYSEHISKEKNHMAKKIIGTSKFSQKSIPGTHSSSTKTS